MKILFWFYYNEPKAWITPGLGDLGGEEFSTEDPEIIGFLLRIGQDTYISDKYKRVLKIEL